VRTEGKGSSKREGHHVGLRFVTHGNAEPAVNFAAMERYDPSKTRESKAKPDEAEV